MAQSSEREIVWNPYESKELLGQKPEPEPEQKSKDFTLTGLGFMVPKDLPSQVKPFQAHMEFMRKPAEYATQLPGVLEGLFLAQRPFTRHLPGMDAFTPKNEPHANKHRTAKPEVFTPESLTRVQCDFIQYLMRPCKHVTQADRELFRMFYARVKQEIRTAYDQSRVNASRFPHKRRRNSLSRFGQSMRGFLDSTESLLEVFKRDRATMAFLDFDYDNLANTLTALFLRPSLFPDLEITRTDYMGTQDCPFGCKMFPHDNLRGSEIMVARVDSPSDRFLVAGLVPHLISAHHFFEGQTPYRVDPLRAQKVLGNHLSARFVLTPRHEYEWCHVYLEPMDKPNEYALVANVDIPGYAIRLYKAKAESENSTGLYVTVWHSPSASSEMRQLAFTDEEFAKYSVKELLMKAAARVVARDADAQKCTLGDLYLFKVAGYPVCASYYGATEARNCYALKSVLKWGVSRVT